MHSYSKKAILFIIIMCLLIVSATAAFTDTSSHWSKSVVEKWETSGIIKGYNGMFRPDETITRAEFSIILDRLFGFTKASETSFGDIEKDSFYESSVLKATAAGVIKGSDGLFKPNDTVTRQEVAVMIARAFKLKASDSNKYITFSDASSISSWAQSSVSAVVENKFMSGYDNKFNPLDGLTRAEAIKIIDNAITKYADKADEISGIVDGSVFVKKDGTVLKDLTINKNLYIAPSVGEGDITLDNVKIIGTTVILGGGSNSIHIKNSTIGNVIVDDSNGKVRIVAQGSTSVGNVVSNSIAKFEEKNLTGSGFSNITIEIGGRTISLGGISDNSSIEITDNGVNVLSGKIDSISVDGIAAGAQVSISSGVTVSTFTANSQVSVTGSGTVSKAVINVNNVTMDKAPSSRTIADGISAVIAGSTVSNSPSSGGSSGSSGGGSSGGGSSGGGTIVYAVDNVTVSTSPVDTSALPYNSGNVTVTLSTTTAGATIYYTTDGSTPSSSSTQYSTPFAVSNSGGTSGSTLSVKAIAVKSGYTNSAVAQKTIVYNAVTTSTVTTAGEFVAALQNNNIGTITLGSDITGNVTATRTGSNNFTINFGTYTLTGNLNVTANSVTAINFNGTAVPAITGYLEVAAANATVTNGIVVGGTITVTDIGSHSWIEQVDSNTIVVHDDNGGSIVINGNPAGITVVDTADGVNITANTPVAITVIAGANVASITANAAGTNIVNYGTVSTVTANADIAIENNNGSITVAGTATVGTSGTDVANITAPTATVVAGISADLGVDATLRMGSATTANITVANLAGGETFNVTSANTSIITVYDATSLAITALKPGKAAVTVKVYNGAGTLIKQGTIFVTVLPEQIHSASVVMVAPVAGAAPQTAMQIETATANSDYTVTSVTWEPALTVAGKFKAGHAYTATIVLTSKNDKSFSNSVTPTVSTAASVDAVGNTISLGTNLIINKVTFTATFAATAALAVDSIEVTTQPTKMSYIEGDTLELDGMVVTETNNDGTTNVVTFTNGTAAGYTASPSNGVTLSVATHNGHAVTITNTVSNETATTNNLTVNSIPTISATPIDNGASNPSTVISLTNDTFTAGAENTDNWTFNYGTTGLTVNSITLQGSAGVATGVTIDFSGTASAGTLSIQPKAAALTSGATVAAASVVVPAADTTAQDNADIATAKGVLEAATLNPIEGTNTNVLTMAQALVNAQVTGVTVSISDASGNANVGNDGAITYTVSSVTGNVVFALDKGMGTQATSTVSVVVPQAEAITIEGVLTSTGMYDFTGIMPVGAGRFRLDNISTPNVGSSFTGVFPVSVSDLGKKAIVSYVVDPQASNGFRVMSVTVKPHTEFNTFHVGMKGYLNTAYNEFTYVVGDVDNQIKLADDVKFIENNEFLYSGISASDTAATNKAAWFYPSTARSWSPITYRFIDNDNDGKYDYAIRTKYGFAKVVNLTDTKIQVDGQIQIDRIDGAGNSYAWNAQLEGVAADDYVLYYADGANVTRAGTPTDAELIAPASFNSVLYPFTNNASFLKIEKKTDILTSIIDDKYIFNEMAYRVMQNGSNPDLNPTCDIGKQYDYYPITSFGIIGKSELLDPNSGKYLVIISKTAPVVEGGDFDISAVDETGEIKTYTIKASATSNLTSYVSNISGVMTKEAEVALVYPNVTVGKLYEYEINSTGEILTLNSFTVPNGVIIPNGDAGYNNISKLLLTSYSTYLVNSNTLVYVRIGNDPYSYKVFLGSFPKIESGVTTLVGVDVKNIGGTNIANAIYINTTATFVHETPCSSVAGYLRGASVEQIDGKWVYKYTIAYDGNASEVFYSKTADTFDDLAVMAASENVIVNGANLGGVITFDIYSNGTICNMAQKKLASPNVAVSADGKYYGTNKVINVDTTNRIITLAPLTGAATTAGARLTGIGNDTAIIGDTAPVIGTNVIVGPNVSYRYASNANIYVFDWNTTDQAGVAVESIGSILTSTDDSMYLVSFAYDVDDSVITDIFFNKYPVNINAAPVTVSSITVKTAPTKVTYTQGENLDLTGLEVTLTMSDASEVDVALADFAANGIATVKTNGTALATTDTGVVITHTASGVNVTQAITVNYAIVQTEATGYLRAVAVEQIDGKWRYKYTIAYGGEVAKYFYSKSVDAFADLAAMATEENVIVNGANLGSVITFDIYSNGTICNMVEKKLVSPNVVVSADGKYYGTHKVNNLDTTNRVITVAPLTGAATTAGARLTGIGNDTAIIGDTAPVIGTNVIVGSSVAYRYASNANIYVFDWTSTEQARVEVESIGSILTSTDDSMYLVSFAYDTENSVITDIFFNKYPVIIAEAPVISTDLSDVTTTVGSAVILDASATVSDGGTITYQWYSNDQANTDTPTELTGSTSATYTPAVDAAGTFYYYCVVTNTNNTAKSTTSAVATVTVNAAPVTVSSIAVKTAPTKVTYTEGENLDLTGLEVTLTMSDASEVDIALADFAANGIATVKTNGTALATTDTGVVITHTASGANVTQAITVNYAIVQTEATGYLRAATTEQIDGKWRYKYTIAYGGEAAAIRYSPSVDAFADLAAMATEENVIVNAANLGGVITFDVYSNGTICNMKQQKLENPNVVVSAGGKYYGTHKVVALDTNSRELTLAPLTGDATTAGARLTGIGNGVAATAPVIGTNVIVGSSVAYRYASNANIYVFDWTSTEQARVEVESIGSILTSTDDSMYLVSFAFDTENSVITDIFFNKKPVIINAQTPVITTDLSNVTTDVGSAVTLDASATVTDGGTLTYQWYSNDEANTDTPTELTGSTSATYTPAVDVEGTFYYYCVVTNTNNTALGTKTAATTSVVATVTVNVE